MAAIVAAALGQLGDKTAWLVAILSDRYRAPGRIIAAAAIAILAASGLAATGGAFIAPRITPEAKQLFFALSLLLQGGGAFFPVKMPERLSGWRLGAVLTTLTGLFILAFGDGVQFIVLTDRGAHAVPRARRGRRDDRLARGRRPRGDHGRGGVGAGAVADGARDRRRAVPAGGGGDRARRVAADLTAIPTDRERGCRAVR